MTDPDDLPEVVCNQCGWQGDAPELLAGRCPECGSSDVEDYEDYRMTDHESIINSIKSGNAHLTSTDGLRRMFWDDEDQVWQVWGQTEKHKRTGKMIETVFLSAALDKLSGQH